MVDALKKELEEEENKEEEVETPEDATEPEEGEADEPEESGSEEQSANNEEGKDEKPELTDEEKEAKREAYKKRQEERQAKRQEYHREEREERDEDDYLKQEMAQIIREQKFNKALAQAEKELTALEGEYSEAYDDYNDTLKQAVEITKFRLMEQGFSESEADAYVKREKVLLADLAASQGKDPVEAVHKEAQIIVRGFEKFAEANGYIKPEDKKTNLQKMREISKPNAMTGGAGKSAQAAKKTFDEMDDLEEIDNVPLSALMNQ